MSEKTHEIVALALLTGVVAVIAGACPDAHAEPAPPAPGASGGLAVADEAGASLFVRHCSICHSADELAARFRDARDPDRLAEEMRALLDRHGRAGATEDAQIIDYLRRQAR